MTAPVWKMVRFEPPPTNDPRASVWKSHVVPASLQRPLVADLVGRGAALLAKPDTYGGAVKTTDGYRFDYGGVWFGDEPQVKVTTAGMWFTVKVGIYDVVLSDLTKLAGRRFGSVPYYKFHGHYNCLVLGDRHRDKLIAALESQRAAVEAAIVAYDNGRSSKKKP